MGTPKLLVYALVDPRTFEWRYIGRSCQGMARPVAHGQPAALGSSKYYNPEKYKWITELRQQGLDYLVEIVEVFEDAVSLGIAETEWITESRRQGVPLLNRTDGGDGGQLGRSWKWSEESRAKNRARLAQRGFCLRKPLGEDTKRKIRDGKRGTRLTPEHRASISAGQKARFARAHGEAA